MSQQTVLLIDDCSEILERIAEILSLDGFRILKANGGEQAVQLFTACCSEIDLVVSEVMSCLHVGERAVNAVRRIDKNIPVLFVTDLDAYETSKRIGAFENYYLLNKPFYPEELGEDIRSIID
ncbi:response regulator [Mariprofundus sp. NF]|uniref:response regulator n=1 Tax=Mariprofundus sp. NF TaxID=2608716 RepID=UPI00159F7E00